MKLARPPAVLLTAAAAVTVLVPAAWAQQASPAPCAALTLDAPPDVGVRGRVLLVGGGGQPGHTARVLIRKRGQASFTVQRRPLTPDPQGRFMTSYLADDDYRLYDRTTACNTPLELVQPAPVVTGPATGPAGVTVALMVRAAPRTAVSGAIRRAGQPALLTRRRGITDATGTYRTSYRADADYSYYAASASGRRSTTPGRTPIRVRHPDQRQVSPAPRPGPETAAAFVAAGGAATRG